MYIRYLTRRGLKSLPELPEFQLSLKPDEYELPEADPVWGCGKFEFPQQTLKKHLNHDHKETKSSTLLEGNWF